MKLRYRISITNTIKFQWSLIKLCKIYRYMKLGVENTAGVVDIREQVEFATETDSSVAGWKLWPPYERLRGRNQWPDDFQPSLRPNLRNNMKIKGLLKLQISSEEPYAWRSDFPQMPLTTCSIMIHIGQ
mmetsp:Transcript_18627/g.22755  ORF Transcript_18627/g.22755 Transcript_18627/m.22755 type:complete len:129 (+) Transcript_18627:106-492(+)